MSEKPYSYQDYKDQVRREDASEDLLEALRTLYLETADYIRINKLGDVHGNRSMQMARDAILKATGGPP